MISAIIPTFKNEEELIKNLKHNLPYLNGCEIIVVNDDPKQSIKNNLKSFPGIMLIENKKNLGFAGAVHKGILRAGYGYIMLLNSDVVLNDSSYMNAIALMQKDPKTFAVSFAQKEKDGSTVGKNVISWKSGFFQHGKASDLKNGINGWAEGGSCVINKKLYKEIGGFDSLYAPFYWEDIDLSYRAWKAGYRIFFDPGIAVQHHHESTIGKYFSKDEVRSIAYRNQFVFIWKNIEDRSLLISHVIRLLFSLPVMVFKDSAFVKGFWMAFTSLSNIIKKRKSNKIKDLDILDIFNV
jgi:GT2 family glycosyltransferase